MGQAGEASGTAPEASETTQPGDEADERGQPGGQLGGAAGRGRRVLALGLADGLKAALEEGDEEAARIALEALRELLK